MRRRLKGFIGHPLWRGFNFVARREKQPRIGSPVTSPSSLPPWGYIGWQFACGLVRNVDSPCNHGFTANIIAAPAKQ
jgi:hypothetical protein